MILRTLVSVVVFTSCHTLVAQPESPLEPVAVLWKRQISWQDDPWEIPRMAIRELSISEGERLKMERVMSAVSAKSTPPVTAGWVYAIDPVSFGVRPAVRFHEISGEDEYRNRLAEIESGFESRKDRSAGIAVLSLSGPPERRHILLERDFLETERRQKEIRHTGVTIIATEVIRDRDGAASLLPRHETVECFVRRSGDTLCEGATSIVFDISEHSVKPPGWFTSHDLGLRCYGSQVSRADRHEAFERVAKVQSVLMQQRDDESDQAYARRREFLESRLSLFRLAMLDTDDAWLAATWRDTSQPVRVSGKVAASERTELATLIQSLRPTRPVEPRISHEDEFARIECCFSIPPVFKSLVLSALEDSSREFESTVQAAVVYASVREMVLRGTIDVQVSARSDATAGMITIGCLSMAEASGDLLPMIYETLLPREEFDVQRFSGTGGHEFLRFRCAGNPAIAARLPARLSFLPMPEFCFLTVKANCLWFALGGETARNALDTECDRRNLTDPPIAIARQPLLKVEVDLASADWPEGIPSPLARSIKVLEDEFLSSRAKAAVTGIRSQSVGPPSLLVDNISRRALHEKSSRATLQIVQDGSSSLTLESTCDRSLAALYFGAGTISAIQTLMNLLGTQ